MDTLQKEESMYPNQVKMSRPYRRLLPRMIPIVAATLISSETLNAQVVRSEIHSCSSQEQNPIQVTGEAPAGSAVKLDSAGVQVVPARPGFVKSCKLTLNIEAATHLPGIQLMLLSYALQPNAFLVFPPPRRNPRCHAEFQKTFEARRYQRHA
jgi:hypothetical protein